MPVRLRRLKRLLQIDGQTVVIPDAEITTGVITSGGTLTYADSGTDIQTQINTVAASVAAIDIHAHVQENVCYQNGLAITLKMGQSRSRIGA